MPVTLLEKTCGHVGYVRTNYPHDQISCSQCAYRDVRMERIMVGIRNKRTFDEIVLPESDLVDWIKRQLGKR